jgi:tetratricopeptide (TPR) repeat protein
MHASNRLEEGLKEGYKKICERLAKKDEELTLGDIFKEDKHERDDKYGELITEYKKSDPKDLLGKEKEGLYEKLKKKAKEKRPALDDIFNDYIGGELKDEDPRLASIRYRSGASSPEYNRAKADLLFKEKKFIEAANFYRQAGETKAESACMIYANAQSLVNEERFDAAANCYKQVGETEAANACLISWGLKLMGRGYVDRAFDFYKSNDISLSKMPKEMQEKMLDLVKKGNVKITQNLAKLVKTEEEELMFNEARAGMVL